MNLKEKTGNLRKKNVIYPITLYCKELWAMIAFASKVEEMIANHIHDALAQVKQMQELILDKRLFKGYSGTARILSGTVALAGAAVLACPQIPRNSLLHLVGWSVVLLVALLLNYGALLWWFLFDSQARGNMAMLKPAVDAVPPLAVGAGLSVAAILRQDYGLLFGVWMCCYGLVHCAHRHNLPRGIYFTGLGYLAAGACCLVWPSLSFLNPWPMGIVFFAGELAGGSILLINRGKDDLTEHEKGGKP